MTVSGTSSRSVKLASGDEYPLTGLGLWKVPQAECADLVYASLKLGYRLLDGAADYDNEIQAGEGLNRAIQEGLIKREDVTIVSKLWNTFHAAEHVEAACRRSLKDWGVEYFDVYYVHMPISLKYVDPKVRYPPGWSYDGTPTGNLVLEDSPFHKTWEAMEKLVDLGLVKNIAISNMAGAMIADLMRYARIKPAVLQVELHPYLAQPNLVRLARAFNIHVTAYSSFGPVSWVGISDSVVAKCESLFTHSVIANIARSHQATAAQVVLRWASQKGITVIPKSSSEGRLKENLQNESLDLSEHDMDAIDALDIGLRFADPAGIDPRLAMYA
ncbi:uncharacterized protein I206_103747 [Kwoniella pini CBS 10737]|uniref:NADP-dependent oxidoreductase domain-containing protein n=1 Tax=Kwoniella pini CBS 10737 TaxID=1296096 RepID=A0A1B9I8X4_9TREE|nr:uncharacterized protein I206_01254 [Kwoniella pini CBS 10737]OCF51970.1 hypothetical protein I206_01254 [Kwoniella pini CBS 10737]